MSNKNKEPLQKLDLRGNKLPTVTVEVIKSFGTRSVGDRYEMEANTAKAAINLPDGSDDKKPAQQPKIKLVGKAK